MINDDLRFGPDFRYDEILDEDGNPIAGLDIDDEPRRVGGGRAAEFHLQGQHDQKSHGNRGGRAGVSGATVIDETVADRDWAEREGNPRLSGEGDCYTAALSEMEADDRYRLVHGVVSGQGDLDGVRFDHAWVERHDPVTPEAAAQLPPEQVAMLNEVAWTVIDKSNGNDIEMPRPLYYAIGQVNTPQRYTYEEMARKMVETGHAGPWDDHDEQA